MMRNFPHPHDTDKLLSVSAVLNILRIPRHKLAYLFDSRRLNPDEFLTLDNGQRVFRQSDLEKIKRALFEVGSK